jgi:hypothetical protein
VRLTARSPTVVKSLFDRWTLLILLGAGLFMFRGAGRYTVFDDEAFSCRRYVMPLGEMVSALWNLAEPDPPLYYVLQNWWVRVFGVGPVGLRSLSILIFLVGLVFMRLAGQAWFDRRTGLAAMLLCAVHPAHLFFGFAARWYGLMFLCTAVLLWLTARLGRALSSDRPGAFVLSQPEPPVKLSEAGSSELSLGPLPMVEARDGGEERPRWGLSAAPHQVDDPSTPTLPVRAGGDVLIIPPDPLFPRWSERRLAAAWAIAAAATCYTNYFGVVVVALMLAAGVIRGRRDPEKAGYWIWAGVGAGILYLPWLLPFVRQVLRATHAGVTGTAMGASLARTVMALLTGNLALMQNWWVWVPLGVFSAGILVLLLFRRRSVRPIALIVFGSLAAGAASTTMIDKYVMTFSGPACLLVAALLRRPSTGVKEEGVDSSGKEEATYRPRRVTVWLWSRVAAVCLVVGWIGCGANMATERNWSSLRWFDPFEEVIDGIVSSPAAPPNPRLVMTHPSARYYFGCRLARQEAVATGMPSWRVSPGAWRRFAAPPTSAVGNFGVACGTPASILDRIKHSPPPVIVTVETSGFREPADGWGELQGVLERSYTEVSEQVHLKDPDAAWKDRVDPAVAHARWRIVVRWWQLQTAEGSAAKSR